MVWSLYTLLAGYIQCARQVGGCVAVLAANRQVGWRAQVEGSRVLSITVNCITVFWYVRVGKVLQLSTKQSKLMTVSAQCKDTATKAENQREVSRDDRYCFSDVKN